MTASRVVVVAVVACFFLSGATGLIYEVLWIRMLGLVFGHTVFAVTTVLAAFMAGLGLGAWAFGRIADRHPRPLRLYGLLEIGIGVFCLLVPTLLRLVERVYLALARGLDLGFLPFALVQFVLVLLLLLPPTTLMGATLPILSRFFVTEDATLGRRVGLLYALNTLGAVAGTASAGYLLLPALGMQATLALAAALSVAVGAVILVVDHRLAAGAGGAPARQPLLPYPGPGAGGPRAVVAVIGLGLALSGGASMIYEVAWTRALALVLGSSTYAFTAMLVAFLLGIALGSALFSRLLGGRRMGPGAFGLVQLGIGAAALAVLPAFEHLPDLVLRLLAISLSPGFVLVVQVGLATAAMAVPTLLIGASFPCAVQVAARDLARVGGDVGRLYAVNTLGAIVGVVIAGFVLLPHVGAHGTVKTGVAVNLLVGGALVAGGLRAGWPRVAGLGLAAAMLAGVVWLPGWNPAVMASGPAVYARQYQRYAGRVALADAFPDSRVLYYHDGLTATVSVHREGPVVFLRVNGKTDASNGADMRTQLMLGHLPLLVHPDARSVLVVGLASGVTAAAVARHPVERIDVVEIEPAMVEASAFFVDENRHVLRDPRVRLVVGDARNVLLASDRRWDVIISEPSNPWIGGIAALFTEELYALARERLNPGGVLVQWIDGYTVPPADLKMVVKTLRTAFPATSVWNAQMADFLLLARAEPRPIDLDRVEAAWAASPGLRADLMGIGVRSPLAFLADFVLDETDAGRYAIGADVNTDDRLPLEFSAPRSMHRDTSHQNFQVARSFRRTPWPALRGRLASALDSVEAHHDLGAALVAKGVPRAAAAHFERALALDPGHTGSRLALARIQLDAGLAVTAGELLEEAVRREPALAAAHDLLARAYRAQSRAAPALAAAGVAVRLAPESVDSRLLLAALLEQVGRLDEAIEHREAAREARPRDASILDALAAARLRQGRGAEAAALLEQAVALQPGAAALHHRLGRAWLAANRPADAVAALRTAVGRDPVLAPAHADLGLALLGVGDGPAAIAALERALALDPGQAGAAQLLAEVTTRLHGAAAR